MVKQANSVQLSIAAVSGALIGAGLLAGIGSTGGNAVAGGAAGAVLGAAVGVGAYCGCIHRMTAGAIFYGLIGCLLGPAVDDFGGHAAVPFACIGALIAWLGWRYLLTLPAACVAAALFAREPDLWIKAPIGLGIGGWLGTYVGAILERGFGATPGALVTYTSAPEMTGSDGLKLK